jgi:hypothetical protein
MNCCAIISNVYPCPADAAGVDRINTSEWRRVMRISYDKLWKLMKKNKLKKSELATAAEISGYTSHRSIQGRT